MLLTRLLTFCLQQHSLFAAGLLNVPSFLFTAERNINVFKIDIFKAFLSSHTINQP